MRLHRARIKPMQDVDPALLCCAAIKERWQRAVEQQATFVLDVDDVIRLPLAYCLRCGSRYYDIILARMVESSCALISYDHIMLEGVDIDEGEMLNAVENTCSRM